jgi:uncharacterized MnhB-related membrane protein
MMTTLVAVALALLAVLAVATVLSYDPRRQVIVNGFFGLVLTLVFTLLSSPDVAMSAVVVSAVAYPAVVLVTINRTRDGADDGRGRDR